MPCLVKRTRLSLELLAVERFCFESALERIGGFQNSTVTFVLVEITGQLSALQLSELIRRACGSIRLVFSWYPGLLPKLALTLSLGSVLLPKSLEADLSSRCAPTLYRDTFPLGQVTKCCSQMQDAELLSPLDGLDLALARAQTRKPSQRIDWAKNLEQARAFLQEAHAWMEREAEWRSAFGQRQEMLLLLVASDEALVQRHYGAMDGVHIFRLNHAERQVLAPVEALLERVGPSTPKLPIIVLLGVGFITPSKLEDLVARAYVSGVRANGRIEHPVMAGWDCDLTEGLQTWLKL
ncbi:unnamed protein product [Effrenium voratum]|nr:unnamed protein product [Effrenium voratum]